MKRLVKRTSVEFWALGSAETISATNSNCTFRGEVALTFAGRSTLGALTSGASVGLQVVPTSLEDGALASGSARTIIAALRSET
jgi:hypothetical protein